MTRLDRIIDMLIWHGPEEIDADFKRRVSEQMLLPRGASVVEVETQPRCLLAARVAIETLRYFGYDAQPQPTEVIAGNKAFVEHLDDLVSASITPQEAFDLGVRYVQIDTESNRDGRWAGHMVAGLRDENLILDLDAAQFDRPQKGIHIPHPTMLEVPSDWWTDDSVAAGTWLDGGGSLTYRILSNPPPWTHAGDWRKYHRPIVGALVRKIRAELG